MRDLSQRIASLSPAKRALLQQKLPQREPQFLFNRAVSIRGVRSGPRDGVDETRPNPAFQLDIQS